MRGHWIRLAVLTGLAAIVPGQARAAMIYQTGFEAPTSPGPFPGQDGWFAALGASAATVSTGPLQPTGLLPEVLPQSGEQSLRVDGSQLDEFFGFYFGSYARPLVYDPIGNGTPIVTLSADVNLAGDVPPPCGFGIGISAILNGEFATNVQIGLRAEADTLGDGASQGSRIVAYIANINGVVVTGPASEAGEWVTLSAVHDFESRTVRGYFNGVLFGEVPFSTGISNDIYFVNAFLGSSTPIPDTVGLLDNLSVSATANAVPEPGSLALLTTGILGLLSKSWWRRK